MTTGTKIFLALFALIVGTLVVYYGVVMPDSAGASGKKIASSGNGSSKAPGENASREPVKESQQNGGTSTNQVDPRASAPPPRDPAPTVAFATPSQPNLASSAGGLLSEAVREAGGESGGGVVGIEVLKVTPGVDPNATSPNDILPLIGLNNGDLQSGEAARKGDVESVPGGPPAPAASAAGIPDVKPDASPDVPVAAPQAEPKAPPAPSIPPARIEYLIAPGDTFTSIADEWFGDESKWSLIAKENPTVDPQKLKIGQRIFLPPKEAAIATAKPEPVLAEGESVHVVQSGETLIAIARDHFGVDGKWDDIYALNKSLIGADPAALKVGTKLKLPKK